MCPQIKQQLDREIPVNVLKNSEICFFDLTNCINEVIRNNKFRDSLKLSDIAPVYKKLDLSGKAKHRPVSTLSLLTKVFQESISDQLYEYLENYLSEPKSTFHATCSVQANSEMAVRT